MPFGLGKKVERENIQYNTKITNIEKLVEIDKVKDKLDDNEEILLVTTQTKNPLKYGGSMFTPNTLIVTDKKLILRNPSALGLRQKLEIFQYDSIVDMKLEQGVLSSALDINVHGLGYSRIDAISKEDADIIQRMVQESIKKIKESDNQVNTNSTTSISDELEKIAKLKEKDIISDEEFTKMKKDLIDKM